MKTVDNWLDTNTIWPRGQRGFREFIQCIQDDAWNSALDEAIRWAPCLIPDQVSLMKIDEPLNLRPFKQDVINTIHALKKKSG